MFHETQELRFIIIELQGPEDETHCVFVDVPGIGRRKTGRREVPIIIGKDAAAEGRSSKEDVPWRHAFKRHSIINGSECLPGRFLDVDLHGSDCTTPWVQVSTSFWMSSSLTQPKTSTPVRKCPRIRTFAYHVLGSIATIRGIPVSSKSSDMKLALGDVLSRHREKQQLIFIRSPGFTNSILV